MKFLDWDVCGYDRVVAVRFYRSGINPLAAVFLASRGIADLDAARTILGDRPAEIFDPFLLADMDKAVTRIKAAVENGEHIAIYGDYDVDGMTSCALLASWLTSKSAVFEVYIPGRLGEGYGLNQPALDLLKSHGVELVITVDCGITAIEEALYARRLGLGLVITDHHECKKELPTADAVIDPKRLDCGYPYKTLAGVGVVFKLVCALELETGADEVFRRYSDLVAVGTIADVMPVSGENRELIRRGLQILNSNPRPGLHSLIREAAPDLGRITTTTVGYTVAPKLNAAGRMGKPDLSVGLLLTNDSAEAERLTAELCRLNAERRSLEVGIYDEAESMLPEGGPDGPIILSQRGWHQGVTGIVAAKIAERHFAPAVIISIDDNGIGRGSCRSYGPFKIYGALKTCEDLLSNYGGHDMAAGVTIAEENIGEFRRRITSYYHNFIETTPGLGLTVDFEVENPELLSAQNVGALAQLEPFGAGFPPPRLCIRDATITSVFSIGSGKHTRLRIEKSGTFFDCIYFSMSSEDLGAAPGMLADVAFEPQINDFRGRSSVQLRLFDIHLMRPAERKEPEVRSQESE